MVLCLSFGLLGSMASATGETKVSKEKMEKMVEQRFEDSIKRQQEIKRNNYQVIMKNIKGFQKRIRTNLSVTCLIQN
jgi:hypothetical protein